MKTQTYSTWPADQLNNASQNTRTQTKSSQKIEKLKESKLNKNILLAKTLEAFQPKAKFFPIKKTYFKIMFQTYVPKTSKLCSKNLFQKRSKFLFLKLVQYYICKTWNKFIGPWRSINSKINKNIRKKSIGNYKEIFLKIVIKLSSESFLCL